MNYVSLEDGMTDDDMMAMLCDVVDQHGSKEKPRDQLEMKDDRRVKTSGRHKEATVLESIDELDELDLLEMENQKTQHVLKPTMIDEKELSQKIETEPRTLPSTTYFDRLSDPHKEQEIRKPAEELISKAVHTISLNHKYFKPHTIKNCRFHAEKDGYFKIDHIVLSVVQYEVLNDVVVLDLSDGKEIIRASLQKQVLLSEDPIEDREVTFDSFYRIFQPKEDLYFPNGVKLWTGVVLWLINTTLVCMKEDEEDNFYLVMAAANIKGVFEPSILIT